MNNQCRNDRWWRNMWSPNLRLKNFWMSRKEFTEFCEQLRRFVTPNALFSNYRALPVEKQVAITLYF